MGEISLLFAKVGHARLHPVRNSFIYNVFYLKIHVTEDMKYSVPFFFSFNKWNIFSMMTKDHGKKDMTTSWFEYIKEELDKAKIPFKANYKIYLIAHPRLFGFAFNPISYWLVVDGEDNVRAVLCEVHSTFKQNHNYLFANSDNSVILPTDIFSAKKKLYVSPFNKMEGYYEFIISYSPTTFRSVINYFNTKNKQLLNTYMQGTTKSLTNATILQAILQYPLMTIMVVFRIHWQAGKLYIKRMKHTLSDRPVIYKSNQTSLSKKEKK